MRIIAGKAGGIPLKSLKGRDVRPTLDRVKESMFNIIAFYLPKAKVLDLFAGFGNLGIEALSRGAVSCQFVEKNSSHLQIIRENLEKSKLMAGAKLEQQDVFAFLKQTQQKYDLIFMDPPYQRGLTEQAIELIQAQKLLNENALIISERSAVEKAVEFSDLTIIKSKKYGNSLLTIYKLN